MRILLLIHGFNALSQRLYVELREAGHEVTIEFDVSDASTLEAVRLAAPDLILAPYLKRKIPAAVWRHHLCLVLHPGPPGDAGPAALDWAILDGARDWGVTLFEATDEYDSGPIWATRSFPIRAATKASLYRHEVTEAAIACFFEAIDVIDAGQRLPPQQLPQTQRFRHTPRQRDRAIDWQADTTDDVLRKLYASDGTPGVRSVIGTGMVHLHDGHRAIGLTGRPGAMIARSGSAVAIATRDGAVWIGHMRNAASNHPFKLPAAQIVDASHLPEVRGYDDITYREAGPIGFLSFAFLNGAMGTQACERLLYAYEKALARPTKVLVLEGGQDVWSNGMDLNLIEAAPNPGDESWHNINAMDDLAEAVLRTDDKLTVAAVGGNAGAGGVFLARACDKVWLRAGVVLNPHYKDMGNLFGSEFWTYSLPRFTSPEQADAIASNRLPMGAREAERLGLADLVIDGSRADFHEAVARRAEQLAGGKWSDRIEEKSACRNDDEADKPLAAYRAEELAKMRQNFFGFDPSYHIARSNFVRKVPKARTPLNLAQHRNINGSWNTGSSLEEAS
ncbi:MAG: hydrogenase maturation protein [Rhizobiales bacterium]|nr:hydrogenase maturation protein [Hyphomicrobiales bacterium]MBO6698198.1 hydrogenase maturation protein [Hyphomicrobiales bacterium]MBO6735548.1 hydrogenase maturation protein [Hyphomicrobiales bacterium]MBO6910644.1 hydrogenase maturation protein [Hyphomicrobiales bacterium]MBO6956075.1 hydrogenase maturation protein [Hyphomicrobiales bacterium]